MGYLVGEEPFTSTRRNIRRRLMEEYVVADGERCGLHRLVELARLGAGVQPDVAEVGAETLLHTAAHPTFERRSRTAPSLDGIARGGVEFAAGQPDR